MNGGLIDGRYRLGDELRRDADRLVYVAVDERLGRPVTVTWFADLGSEAERQAFGAAAGRAARLAHPHLVPVLDSGTVGDGAYLIEGETAGVTLADKLAEGAALSTTEVERLAEQATEALAFAHSAGVVHGRLSPADVLLDRNGDVRLSGFVAVRPSADLEHLRYQPPEVGLGATPDARSDVFTLAAVVWSAAAGRPAFPGDDSATINLAKIAKPPAPLETLLPTVSRPLSAAVERCLSPNPSARPTDAGELRLLLADQPAPSLGTTVAMPNAAELLAPVDAGRTSVLPAPPRRELPPPLPAAPEAGPGLLPWLGAVIVLALVGGLFFALKNPNAKPPVETGPPVPAVIGKTESVAVQEIRNAGLQATVAERRYSDTVRGGEVIEQEPTAGAPAPEDKMVKLVVSLGPQFVTVPDVRGLSEEDARRLLPKYGLGATVEEAQDPSQPDGVVLAQAPAPGQKVDKGAGVRLFVNHPPAEEPPPATEPAADKADKGEPAPGGVVDEVVGSAVDAAKEKAGEIADEVGNQLKDKAREEADRLKEAAREKVRQKKEELADTIKDRLSGNDK